MNDSDGIEDVVQSGVMAALTAASTVASIAAQARADSLRKAAQNQDTEVNQLHERFEAERQMAAAELRGLEHQDQLTVEEATRAWQLAETWKTDPGISEKREALAKRIEAAFGVDPRGEHRNAAAADRVATAAVVASVLQEEAADNSLAWDSSARRKQSAAQMKKAGLSETEIVTATTADLANATPPTEAIAQSRGTKKKRSPSIRGRRAQKAADLQR